MRRCGAEKHLIHFVKILFFVIVFVFQASLAWAGELDGKGLVCSSIKPSSSVWAHSATPAYGFYFNSGEVERYWVSKRASPVQILKEQGGNYRTEVDWIFWKDPLHQELTLNRKTLLLQSQDQTTLNARCEVKLTLESVLGHFQPVLDKVKEKLKGNKI